MNADDEAARLAHIRRWGRPDFERFRRPDWERYVHPAGHDAVRRDIELHRKAFETPAMRRARLHEEEAERERKQQELEWEAEVAALKADWERLKAELLSLKAGFDPKQPRVEAGHGKESGRWTRDAGRAGGPAPGSADSRKRPLTLGDPNLPDIPTRRPADSRDRTAAIRAVGKLLATLYPPARRAEALVTLIEGASWLRPHQAEIETQLDPPRSLEELQKAVSTDRPGTHVHHIVERSAEDDGIPRSKIYAPNNLVRIGKQQHQQISDWSSTTDEAYGNMTPRNWLRRKSWEERRAVGIKAMIKFRVLKP